ncbi:TonB-dependent receptor [Roseateles albus]|uniref:TonB-dependent receptor n=1 Tax=Roseateles albus TaxID=2987525 RepID=A0ABT5KHM5_9BURK|nr:TonB-dependent receptor [Roseateles albus]MDC8773428.1 TonB-dependent receptor [Roseateles albus]
MKRAQFQHRPSTNAQRRALNVKPVASACAALLTLFAPASQAQQAATPTLAADAQQLDTVVVTGIRRSLESAVSLKRENHGVVDGIVAEDIGKFPDTNLAESMQRISGVSIERGQSGEGSRVTVRGIGADFNMVLLNGRQMPGALLNSAEGGSSANSSRAFDFSNLSSDSVSAIEVFKTSRAAKPAGGIGATINIKTARPLDSKERIASFSVKANHDASNDRLPEMYQGSSITPDLSGIYSDTFANGAIGISISGSFSRRDSGSNKAYTQNGWHPFLGDESGWGAIPRKGEPGYEQITNRPGPNTLYSTPVDLRYALTALERERTNGQLVLQYAPSKDLKFTLDYTMADNTVNKKNVQVGTWFNFQGGPSAWTDGPVAGPISYSALFPAKDHDLAIDGGQYGEKAKNRSTGFNAEWKINEQLNVELDAHSSTAKTGANSPYGTYSVIGSGMFSQGDAIGYYNQDMPILSLPNTVFDTNKIQVAGTRFDNALSDQKIDQAQFRGAYKLSSDDKLNFGISSTKVNNRSASVNHQNGDWGGVGKQGDYAASLFNTESLPSYFGQVKGSDDPRLLQKFYSFDFNAMRARAIEIAMKSGTSSHPTPLTREEAEAYFAAYTDFTKGADLRTTEKSTSGFLQYDHSFDTAIPMSVSVGVRRESTKVESSSQVLSLTGASWGSLNEISVQSGGTTFGSSSGKYSYWLPSIDWDADLTANMKLRASYGETIGRPGWAALAGGVTVGDTANAGGGTGSTGNAALLPLLSKNWDTSLEYYYSKSSYVAAGLFRKNITNFISSTTVRQPVGQVHTPIGGKYYLAAIASGCSATDPKCQRNYIFNNFDGQPGVTKTGVNAAGEIQGTIVGQATDPLLQFAVTTPANAKGDNLSGVELNAQHLFGNSGFGVSGNYTRVSSGLSYDNHSTAAQSALVGVSNSYNLVGFYEGGGFSVRGAYNWRGEFLAATTDGAGNNPIYTEPYGQMDMTIAYRMTKNLTFQADFLNLNDGVIRQHGRTKEQLVSVTQTGRRYLVGARYSF